MASSSGAAKNKSYSDIMHESDLKVLREEHQFIRDDNADAARFNDDWKVRMSRKYYDRLYKEFAVIDLSRYKEGKFGLRWRVESEVLAGKGQKACGCVSCPERQEGVLTTFELPFMYREHNETKTELVKVKLCHLCSDKLMHKKRKEQRADGENYLKDKAAQESIQHEQDKKQEREQDQQERDRKNDKKRKQPSQHTDEIPEVPYQISR